MTIHGFHGANAQTGQAGMNQAEDSYSRNIQNQIASAQKQLQELSSNEDMPPEEKMKKRQEIQRQISDLNVQLRQHQMEQRRAAMSDSKKQQAKGSSRDDMSGGTGNAGKTSGLSQANMTAMLSADASMKQARIQGNAATGLENRANILKAEIKQDGNAEAKKEELAKVEQKAADATALQMKSLAEANKTAEDAKADNQDEKTTEAKEKDSEENISVTGVQGETAELQSEDSDSESKAESGTTAQEAVHKHIDIRL